MVDETQKAQLWVLARAWRLAWSDFDGRILRSQIEDIIGDTPPDIGLNDADVPTGVDAGALREWMQTNDICSSCGCWHDVCECKDGVLQDDAA